MAAANGGEALDLQFEYAYSYMNGIIAVHFTVSQGVAGKSEQFE